MDLIMVDVLFIYVQNGFVFHQQFRNLGAFHFQPLTINCVALSGAKKSINYIPEITNCEKHKRHQLNRDIRRPQWDSTMKYGLLLCVDVQLHNLQWCGVRSSILGFIYSCLPGVPRETGPVGDQTVNFLLMGSVGSFIFSSATHF